MAARPRLRSPHAPQADPVASGLEGAGADLVDGVSISSSSNFSYRAVSFSWSSRPTSNGGGAQTGVHAGGPP